MPCLWSQRLKNPILAIVIVDMYCEYVFLTGYLSGTLDARTNQGFDLMLQPKLDAMHETTYSASQVVVRQWTPSLTPSMAPSLGALACCLFALSVSSFIVPVRAETATIPGLSVELPGGPVVRAPSVGPAVAPGLALPAKPKPAAKAAVTKKKTEKTAAKSADEPLSPGGSREQAIIALVNDEPITGYEIQQRAALIGGGNLGPKAQANFKALIQAPSTSARLKDILAETIKANEGKSRDEIIQKFEARKKDFALGLQKQAVESARASEFPSMKKAALDELIDEKIKSQEAKRTNVSIGDEDVDRVIAGIAERNKLTKDQMAAQLGNNLGAMRARIRATLSWTEVVRRQFGGQIQVTSKDVDKLMASNTTAAEDDVELQIQRIRLAMPVKIDQAGVAARMQEAEKIRSKFADCKTSNSIANGVAGAKFDDLGRRKPGTFSEPTRTLLLNAKDGDILPPSVGDGGIDLFVVCGREIVKADDQKRTQVEGELRQKEFELMSKKRLKDLRQDAHIEYRE